MYKINQEEFANLELAMTHAKQLNEFVTITGPDFEVVGKFGVDTVQDGLCPDGVVYDWNKASRIGRVRREPV
jgi:Uma2 family endonuclease